VTVVYALSLVIGVGLVAPAVIGARRRPPRVAVALLLGVGLGGMSSSFAGWAAGPSMMAALGGGVVLAVAARYLASSDAGEAGE